MGNLMEKAWMHEREIEAIESHFNDAFSKGPVRVFEYGAGGSTVYFPRKFPEIEKWYATEHDQRTYITIKDKVAPSVEVFFHEVDHPTARPGDPKEFRNYIRAADDVPEKINFAIIDGRCRPHCARAIIPHLAPEAKVFLHDAFNPDFRNPKTGWRRNYHQVLRYYDLDQRVDTEKPTLAVLRLKPELSANPEAINKWKWKWQDLRWM